MAVLSYVIVPIFEISIGFVFISLSLVPDIIYLLNIIYSELSFIKPMVIYFYSKLCVCKSLLVCLYVLLHTFLSFLIVSCFSSLFLFVNFTFSFLNFVLLNFEFIIFLIGSKIYLTSLFSFYLQYNIVKLDSHH